MTNQDDVAAFMEELGFEWRNASRLWISRIGRPWYLHGLTNEQAQFWYTTLQQANRQLLDEVEAAGPKDREIIPGTEKLLRYSAGIEGANEQNILWHQAIQVIKERLDK